MITGSASTGTIVYKPMPGINTAPVRPVWALILALTVCIILSVVTWFVDIFLTCSGAWFGRSDMVKTLNPYNSISAVILTVGKEIDFSGEVMYNSFRKLK